MGSVSRTCCNAEHRLMGPGVREASTQDKAGAPHTSVDHPGSPQLGLSSRIAEEHLKIPLPN